MAIKSKCLIHIFTGDGKGKTTAALGLALRSIGAGKKVALVQFLKKPNYSEHKAIKKYKLPIDVFAYGIGYYISSEIPRIAKQFYKISEVNSSREAQTKAAQKALEKAQKLIESNKYDLIILDEINVAVGFGLVKVEEVIDILITNNSIRCTDIILTGRRAHPKLKKIADLVTEMKKEKHYFDKGLKARKGIEF